jgi:hypothetical protein
MGEIAMHTEAKITNTEANFARISSQLCAKPPIFSRTLREQLYVLKNEDAI